MDEKKGLKDESAFPKVENKNVENIRKPGKPKGLPKSGGRQAGTPNKSTKKWSEILDLKEFNIPEESIKLFLNESTPPHIKLQILQFLAQYTTASIKPKEDESDEDESIPETSELNTNNILKLTNGEKE